MASFAHLGVRQVSAPDVFAFRIEVLYVQTYLTRESGIGKSKALPLPSSKKPPNPSNPPNPAKPSNANKPKPAQATSTNQTSARSQRGGEEKENIHNSNNSNPSEPIQGHTTRRIVSNEDMKDPPREMKQPKAEPKEIVCNFGAPEGMDTADPTAATASVDSSDFKTKNVRAIV
jgi:hypothetical protein